MIIKRLFASRQFWIGTIYCTDQVVDKVMLPYVTQQKVEMLRSTAFPAPDKWSVENVPYQTEGKAIQLLFSEKEMSGVVQ